MISDEELDRLQALTDAASPGPWAPKAWDERVENLTSQADPRWPMVTFTNPDSGDELPHHVAVCENNGQATNFGQDNRNAEFIAAARQAVPELIAQVRELKMVVRDMLEDGYERGRAGKYKRALERIVEMRKEGKYHLASLEVAQEALREDEDEQT